MGGEECSDGECGSEDSSLLALMRTVSEHNATSDEATRRRKSPVTCRNPDGTKFKCAGGTGAVAAHVWARATSVARMRTGTASHAKGRGGNAAAMHALRPAASAVSRRVRRVDGIPLAKAPSADRRR